jgi:LuxR family maltose regulon positive regulatory protein
LLSDAEINLRLAAGAYLLRYGTSVGDMGFVRQVLPPVEELAQHPDATPLARGLCEFFVAWSHINLLGYGAVAEAVARVESLAKQYALPQLRRYAAIPALWSAVLHRRHHEADAWLAVLQRVVNPDRLYDLAQCAAAQALTALARGDAKPGLRSAQEATILYDRLGSSWHRLFGRGLLMWAHIDLDQFAEAEQYMVEAEALSQQFNIGAYDVHRHQARAMIALKRGDRAALDASLRELFTCTARYGTGMPARFFFTWMPRLCAAALAAQIEEESVRELIRAFGWHCEGVAIERWPWAVRIYTLGRFEVYLDDEPLARSPKAPRKMLSLLKALICLGGAKVRDHRLVDALWPDDEADAGRAAFNVTLHRLRRLLGHTDAIQVEDGLVSLNPQLCWVDALAFERLANQAAQPDGGAASVQPALALYRGNLLPADEDEPWATAARERLRAKLVRVVGTHARELEARHQWEPAAALYSRGLDADELIESFYQGLMRCQLGLARPAEAMSAYRRLRQVLGATLGLTPSPETEALCRRIGARLHLPV